jgi:formate/nitrite transporter FocA (FNT family)
LELLLAFWVSQRFIPARISLILIWVGIWSLFRGFEHIVAAFAVRSAGKEMAAAA